MSYKIFSNKLSLSAFLLLCFGLLAAIAINQWVTPYWYSQKTTFEVQQVDGQLFYNYRGDKLVVPNAVPIEQSPISMQNIPRRIDDIDLKQQWVVESRLIEGVTEKQYSLIEAKLHFGLWSLLPAIMAIVMSMLMREPLTGLLSGIITGALMLGYYDITDTVIIPNLASKSAASILLLYLWLLGGLLGIWSKIGAAQAFANSMTKHFVRGPRSAKFVAWCLGVIFFQGGTISTVLVGTTVKPLADHQNVSHEEMSYVVDSTASPIAILLPFNAWPVYIQSFLFIPGVAFLATEADRLAFFFKSIPLNFYAILAITGTFLLCFDFTRFAGKGISKALHRSRETGALNAPNATPLSAKELHNNEVPENYSSSTVDFVLPITVLLSIAVGTFFILGSPKVNWAFAIALLLVSGMALFKGLSMSQLIDGFATGLKGVVLASIILMLAIVIGNVSREVGSGQFMIELVGSTIPFWLLPVLLQFITMVIAFATGSSWGTYAIAFPLTFPLAWAIAQGLPSPEFYMLICFAAILNGSVYGDQCSPISDTTILSSMATGADLMDHVKTQIVPATLAAVLAGLGWTLLTLFV